MADNMFDAMIEYHKALAEPMIKNLRDELFIKIDSLISQVGPLERRINVLEAGQRKALWGWGVYFTTTSILIGTGLNWLIRKLRFVS